MKTNNFLKKAAAMVAVVSLGFAFSCQENESPYATEASYVAEETVTDYYFEDADDMAGMAVAAEPGAEGGKISSEAGILTVDDDRFCASVSLTVVITSSEPNWPVGDITINFGAGCEDPRGNVRSGKIKVHFEGRRFLPGSSLTITFENYVINGIILNGTRVLTNIAESTEVSPKFRVYLNGSVTWPDNNTTATREHCYEREWIRALNPLDDEWHVTQCANTDEWPHNFAATGINRRGVEYEMAILTKLVYKRGCPIAVSGVKEFTNVATGKVITVDYGDGDCDRIITIMVNGNTRTVNVNRRG